MPAAAALQFALVGLGWMRDERLVAGASVSSHITCPPARPPTCTHPPTNMHPPAMQRTNRREELLRGPLLYAFSHVAATLLLWRHSPGGVAALAVLCGGDGLAEVVGRGVRSPRLPHSRRKTLAGSLACLVGGGAAALALLLHFRGVGMFDGSEGGGPPPSLQGGALLRGVALCALAGAAAESLDAREVDNLTVPLAVAATSRLVFGC